MRDDVFDIREVLGLLRRRWKLIVVTIVLLLAIAMVAIFVVKPVYTASTLILVDTGHKNLLTPDTSPDALPPDSSRVDSEAELVRSEATLLHVISDNKLVNDPEFGVKLPLRAQILGFLHIERPLLPTGNEALQSVLTNLSDALSVRRRGETNLIAIDVKARNAETAAAIANAVATTYVHDQLQAKIDATLAARNIIQARIADANSSVAASENAFDDFITTNMDSIAAATGRDDLAVLRRQLDEATSDGARASTLSDVVSRGIGRDDWQAVADALKSETIISLNDQRKALEQGLALAPAASGEAVSLRAELAKIDTSLTDTATTQMTSLKGQIVAAQAKAGDLRAQLRASVLASNLPAGVLTSIYGLQQNSEIARSQYQTLLARLKDLEIQGYLQVADSRVVSPALPPGAPSFPNPKLILSLAGIAGLGLGIALAFVYENLIGGFISEDQVRSVLRMPVIGAVLRQRNTKLGGNEAAALGLADFIVRAPLSLYSESVRRLRVGVDQGIRRLGRPKDEARRGVTMMITSAVPDEGKTTLALSLARIYALSGKSTILIDCDLRKPSVHKQLGIDPSPGLLDFLSRPPGSVPLASILWLDESSFAQIVVGARRSDLGADQLVTGASFAHLLEEAARAFEIVILDTPPVGSVVDGLYLAQLVDVIVFVTRWASTAQQDALHAVNALAEAKNPKTEILAVLNQLNISSARYQTKYSSYYTDR